VGKGAPFFLARRSVPLPASTVVVLIR
jgi:hypothetical protein